MSRDEWDEAGAIRDLITAKARLAFLRSRAKNKRAVARDYLVWSLEYVGRGLSSETKTVLARLPERFQWTLHNLIAHPLSEVLYQIGLGDLGNRLHDATIPPHTEGEGRG